ncbi:MAG TPA: glutathione S-transferase C-terminal domain-containing protein [Solirubrobacteraceae bacterium]|nr:glutathione S-transferase C-terminal domain-containing protein [Solirubrobacteraceae bacterium]
MADGGAQTYVLYGMPASLYTGKARSYLRKHAIAHIERAAGDARFAREVLPRIGRWIIPVLETPDGTLIQDTVDIIDHFEAGRPAARSAYPAGGVQRCVAHVLELFGGEGLLRPAMHYRWNFDEHNLAFLAEDFGRSLAPAGDAAERAQAFATASGLMRRATLAVGVDEHTAAAVESSYAELLALLDAHLASAPYLLGGRPTIADFGFIGPLYAHLARDPYPSLVMKRAAAGVWRWVERMNAPVADTGEYVDYPEELFGEDAVPETLRELLAYIGEEFVPELLAQVAFVDAWLREHETVQEGEVVGGAPQRRSLGSATFTLRGREARVGVLPYRLFMLQRLQDAFAACREGERRAVRDLFARVGLEPVLDARACRRVERRDNHEVWGALRDSAQGSA